MSLTHNDHLVSGLAMDPLSEKIDPQMVHSHPNKQSPERKNSGEQLNHSHPNKMSPEGKNSNELSIFSNFEDENNANLSISNLEDKKALSPIPENRQDDSKLLQEELFPPAEINESDPRLIVEVQIESPNQQEQPLKNCDKEDDAKSEAEAQESLEIETDKLKKNIEFNFKVIKCPNHFKEEIIFICNATDCPMKFICAKCLVDDLKQQTRHHITHEQFFISYDENVFKAEYEKFLVKKNNFDKILEDQDYLLLKQIENGDISSIIQKKYQNEVNEIESFVASATAKTEDILAQYKGLIKDNVALETKSFVKGMLEKFVCLKGEFHGKTEKLMDMQRKSKDIFSKTEDECSNEKVNLFLSLHNENQEEILCQKFNAFMQYSIKTLKEYTSKESNRPLKYEFYVNLMNTLKAMINEKIPKNLLNSNYSLLLKTKVNHLTKEDESKKSEKGADVLFVDKPPIQSSVPQKSSTNNISNKASPNDIQNGSQKPPNNMSAAIIDVIDSYKNQVEILNAKNSHNIDYSMVLDICLIGPTDKQEYFVATCCSREKFIKIWTISKERPPVEHRSLEGHNKSTYKLFYCHEKKWLLSAGFYPCLLFF